MSEAENINEQMGELPPATFDFLVFTLRSQVEIHLGLLPAGPEGETLEPNLGLARHMIDTLSMLQEKTKGNLDLEEKRYLENSLTELRYRYVQVLEATRKSAPKAESQQP